MNESVVLLDIEATEEEIAAVRELFREVNLDLPVEAAHVRMSAEDLPSFLMIVASLKLFLAAFTTSYGTVLGTKAAGATPAAARRLCAWVSKLYAARRDRDRTTVHAQDVDSGLDILLRPGLPEEAFRQLLELDLDEVGGVLGQIYWSEEEGRWVSPE